VFEIKYKIRPMIIIFIVILDALMVCYNFNITNAGTEKRLIDQNTRSLNPRIQSGDEYDWGTIKVLSEPVPGRNFCTGHSMVPQIAVEGDKIYTVWSDLNNTNSAGTDSDIFYRYFNGNSWSNIEVISEPVPGKNLNTGGGSGPPAIAVENGNIHVAWADSNNTNGAGTDSDIFYRHFDGTKWSKIEVISEPISGQDINTGGSMNPDIVVENGNIYVVWCDLNNTNGAGTEADVFYKCNLSGKSWEPVQVISEPIEGQNFNDMGSLYPMIEVDKGKIYVVWQDANNTNGAGSDEDIFFRCNLTGKYWEPVQVISEPVEGQNFNTGSSKEPDIAIENDKIHIVWYDDNNTNGAGLNNDIFYRCNLNGKGWEPVQVISEPIPGQDVVIQAIWPRIATEYDCIFAVWCDSSYVNGAGGDGDILFRCNISGSGWDSIQVISEPIWGKNINVEVSAFPTIAVENKKCHIVWEDFNNTDGAGTADWDVFYRNITYLGLGPDVVYSVKVYSDITFTNEISIAEIGDDVYIELIAEEENSSREEQAAVIVSTDGTPSNNIQFFLLETDLDTGIFHGSFKISNYTNSDQRTIKADLGENITVSSITDPTKNATILVSTPVQLRPLNDKTYAIEDENYITHYWNFGYNSISKWRFETNASWLNWNENNHNVYGLPDNGDVGTFWVLINVTDGMGNFDEHNFTITVNNTPPEITTLNDLLTLEDEQYLVDYNSSDDGQGIITWFLSTNATWLDLDYLSGVLSGTPTNDDRGYFWVNITVYDGNDGIDWSNFSLSVIDTNDPPIIVTENIITAIEDVLYLVEYQAMDIDDDQIFEWNLNTNATWLSIGKTSGLLSGIPNNEDVGIYFVNITVSDFRDGRDYQNFTLEVVNVNDAPEWLDVPDDTNIDEGELFYFDANATDVDAKDQLNYNLSSEPTTNITIDQKNGLIKWIANIKGLGTPNFTLEIILSVTDGNVTIKAFFKIQVTINPRPTVSLISPANNSRVSAMGIEFK
jgi:hypothetical protein